MVEYQILPRSNGTGSVTAIDEDFEDDEVIEIDFTKPSNDDPNASSKTMKSPASWFQIAVIVYQRAIPLALTFSLGNVANFIMLYFAGHLPAEEEGSTETFAGVSMSILFTSISCLSIFLGMTGAVETLGEIFSLILASHSLQGVKTMEPRTTKRWALSCRDPSSS
jgi:hypothetical protein